MRTLAVACLAVLWLAQTGRVAIGQAGFAVEGLRCEYLSNPLGIDVETPRLSWRLTPGPRGRRQSAYQLLVASTPALLEQNKGDLQDSGKVSSPETTFVAYAGRPLSSGAQAWWKVRAWDEEGRATPWSAPAHWSMGVLHESEWYGRWIGLARPADVKEGTPLPFPWLRKTVKLDKKPARATAYVKRAGLLRTVR